VLRCGSAPQRIQQGCACFLLSGFVSLRELTLETRMEDRELLDEYVKSRSQSSFGELVTRYLPVVYSAARRMVRDSHLAEEVAQSAFATLAQKADSIRPPQVLGGWLYNTTRHLAMHAVRAEQRRREREQIACAMHSLDQPPHIPEIAEHLEPAMAELKAEDRDALVLRYLGNRALREVGAELGISEEAARKRVTRALERLRTVLEHHSVSSTTVLLATALAASVVPVPNGLGAAITTTALLPAATGAITKAAVVSVKTKALITSMAGAILIGVGVGIYIWCQSKPVAASSALVKAAIAPIKLPNDAFVPGSGYLEPLAVAGQQIGPVLLTLGVGLQNDERYFNEIASDVRRTTNSLPAGHIKCLVNPVSSGSVDYLASMRAGNRALRACRFIHHNVSSNSPLLGKRIRISGWLKTREVGHWAGASLVILNAKGHVFASDPMTDRPLSGSSDWDEIEMITDVPAEPCTLYFGPMLHGTGELWADDFQIAIAPPDKPITDDRIWHVWSPNPGDYSVTTDFENQHEGRPSLCLAYTPTGAVPAGSWMWWGQCIRDPDKYRGHTVRMTVWAKSENLTGQVRPNLRPKGAFFKLLAQDKRLGGKLIRRTIDWTEHTFLCEIPEETQCLDTGFAFHGGGRVWIDMESLTYEIADGEMR
jgi:RNA polymerase sigma factor (sigma-70 family)